MSEHFAKTLIQNLDRRIRFEQDLYTKKALKHMRDAIKETMIELGYDMK